MVSLDTFDLALLAAFQRNRRATRQQLSEQIHLPTSQVGQHLAQFESEGVVESCRVVFSPTGLGPDVTIFTSVELAYHSDAIVERFHEEVSLFDAVQECHSIAGDADYMLHMVVPNLPASSEFVMYKLMRVPDMDSVRSSIVLTALKRDGTLPLFHLGGRVRVLRQGARCITLQADMTLLM